MFRKPLLVAAVAIAGLSFTASADAKAHHRHAHRQMHAVQILPPSLQRFNGHTPRTFGDPVGLTADWSNPPRL
jgi:hypothetical protein